MTVPSDGSPRLLHVLVVDDEPPAVDELRFLLEGNDQVGSVATAGSAKQAAEMIVEGSFDAVFLDIEMPDLSGLALTRELRGSRTQTQLASPLIVFVTAYEHHAVEAFEVDAVDYVLKPIGADRLAQAVRRVVAALPAVVRPVGAEAEAQRELARRVPVEANGRTIFIERQDVHVVEASRDYVKLHTAQKSHLVRIPISALEQVWSPLGFLRVHRSYLVSVEKVRELRTDDGGTTIVVGNIEVPVSRTYARDLKQRLLKGR